MPDSPKKSERKLVQWRSISDLAARDSTEPQPGEFPEGVTEAPDTVSRRAFLRLASASLALGGSACTDVPREKILPYVNVPEKSTPGIAQTFATSFVLDGHATGLLVRSHQGRPTKVEGNPQHPASLGASGVYEQASVLGLYDPDRSREIEHRGTPANLDQFVAALKRARNDKRGASLRLLMPPQSSPSIAGLIPDLRQIYPGLRVTFWSPVAYPHAREGSKQAFGKPLQPIYDLSAADVVVALDADLLSRGPMHLRYAREFAARRTPDAKRGMNRLHVAEPSLTLTGTAADHRLPIKGSEIVALAYGLFQTFAGEKGPEVSKAVARFISMVSADLRAHRGASLVVAGDRQPPKVHALCNALNARLGNIGRTLRFIEPTLLESDQTLQELTREMHDGRVETLVIMDCNPVYSAPFDLGFKEALRRVKTSVVLDEHVTETAAACTWFLPEAHYLEAWGDARAYDGTVSFIQPLIRPLYSGRTPAELIALLSGKASSAHSLLKEYWGTAAGKLKTRRGWEQALALGLVEGTSSAPVQVELTAGFEPDPGTAVESAKAETIEIDFAVSPSVYDGRYANNPWLLELPHPIGKVSWDNPLLIGPELASRLQVETEQLVQLEYRGRRRTFPVLVVPGQAANSASVLLGYGRSGGEKVAADVGVNAYSLRAATALAFASGVTLTATPERRALALTQSHWSLENRPHALTVTLDEFKKGHNPAEHLRGPQPSLLPMHLDEQKAPQWAMTIDLSKCIGCQSCMVACQAENNIPVVGKVGVLKSREMYWLRIDTYHQGVPDAPDRSVHQPMLCQHCEMAPCEYVCPVFATVHSPDGLNEMVYNRCIGTRFCSNNCPYKVRRFNWFDFVDRSQRALQKNPSVTVRERGVMEKCTYCVQRIREAGIRDRRSSAKHKTEVMTACQQACPTQAIVFGDMKDPASDVSRSRKDARIYSVLHELGTRPRTQYLVQLRNPSSKLS